MNEKTLFNKLKNNVVLKKIVGPRILPNNLDKNIKKPALVYFKYGRNKNRLYLNGGEVNERYQINIYTDKYNQAKDVESEIIKMFDGVEDTTANSFSKVTDVKDFYNDNLNMIVVELEITNY